jgi:hypothetical protein
VEKKEVKERENRPELGQHQLKCSRVFSIILLILADQDDGTMKIIMHDED